MMDPAFHLYMDVLIQQQLTFTQELIPMMVHVFIPVVLIQMQQITTLLQVLMMDLVLT